MLKWNDSREPLLKVVEREFQSFLSLTDASYKSMNTNLYTSFEIVLLSKPFTYEVKTGAFYRKLVECLDFRAFAS